MIEIKASEIIRATGAELVQGSSDQLINKISTDSRTIKSGDVFLALRGPNFNGGDFINDAIENGAMGYIAENAFVDSKLAIKVEDPLKFLHALAEHVLQKVAPQVVAITGSTGKTSVKDILKSVLSLKYDVLATKANYNNEIGLPLTVLELTPSTEVVILEMGMRGIGHIDELTKIAQPDLALVTNIGNSHIELLETQENILRAKAEIINGLKDDGTFFVNADDESTTALRELADSREIISFGKNGDVSCEEISSDELGRAKILIKVEGEQAEVNIPASGSHHAQNACAAAAIALKMGLSLEEIKKGLEQFKLSPGRMEVLQENGLTIINDTYNSAPDSVIAALDALSSINSERKIAILGSMLELGDSAKEEHERVGRYVATQNVDSLITVGELALDIKNGAIKAGMSEDNIKTFSDYSQLQEQIDSLIRTADAILVKGSRKIELENIVHYLQKKR